MAATFSYSDSLATDLDLVRFLTGDTVSGTQLFSDEEIEALLVVHTNAETCAGYCLRILANDPERAEGLWDSTFGSFSRISLCQKMGKFADRWLK